MLRTGHLVRSTTLVFCMTGTASAKGQTAKLLTNGEIVRMARARLSAAVIVAAVETTPVEFDLSPDGLIGLRAAGVPDQVILAMQARSLTRTRGFTSGAATRGAPERSEFLATSKDPEFILRNFRTMLVHASPATSFERHQMEAALASNKDFAAFGSRLWTIPPSPTSCSPLATPSLGTIPSH